MCNVQLEKAALRTQYGVKDIPNALLELPIDLHKYIRNSVYIHVVIVIVMYFSSRMIVILCISYRSTPVETLHTVLLGPYKYLLHSLMGHLTSAQKEDLQARLSSFDFTGLDYKLSYNIIRHFRSFVGRDFKALAQVSLFLLGPLMSAEEKKVWLSLSKVCVYSCKIVCL